MIVNILPEKRCTCPSPCEIHDVEYGESEEVENGSGEIEESADWMNDQAEQQNYNDAND